MILMIIIVLDFIGTAAFAIAGAYRGIKMRVDLLGVIIAGVLTATGGGTLRDVFIYNEQPFWVDQVGYLIVAILAALLTFLIPGHFSKNYHPYRFLDAVGLGIFMVLGVYKGVEAGLHPLICLISGLLPAIGGGILRAVSLGELPAYVLRAGFYGAPAVLGGCLFLLLNALGCDYIYNIFISAFVIIAFRMYGSSKGWHLPVAQERNFWEREKAVNKPYNKIK